MFRAPYSRLASVFGVTVILALLGGGTAATVSPVASGSARGSDDHIDYVISISVDGLNPDAIGKLGPEGAPALYRMIRQGAYTLNARTLVESTSTLPNHTGQLTARRVASRRGGHGVSFNADPRGSTVHDAAGRYVASVWDVVHDHGGTTALYTSKAKFAFYDRTWNGVHGRADTVGPDDGRDKIDRFTFLEDETALVDQLVRDLKSAPPTYAFVHLSMTDKVGHAWGYMSDRYLAQVRVEDARVGRILRAVKRSPLLQAHALVLLTSDHGGRGRSHRDQTKTVNYTVPLLAWGPGVRHTELYRAHPT